MKNWIKPEVVEYAISATAQGKKFSNKPDEIRVDQDGNYWASFASGEDSNPDLNGEVIVVYKP